MDLDIAYALSGYALALHAHGQGAFNLVRDLPEITLSDVPEADAMAYFVAVTSERHVTDAYAATATQVRHNLSAWRLCRDLASLAMTKGTCVSLYDVLAFAAGAFVARHRQGIIALASRLCPTGALQPADVPSTLAREATP